MQTILITGANGFLASNILKSIIGRYKIIVLEKHTENLSRLKDVQSELLVYDIDNHSLEEIFEQNNIDIILHTATVYGRNNESVETIIATNFLLPNNLLQLAIKYNTKTFINVDTVLDKATSPYSLAKAQFHDWLILFSNKLKVVNMQLEHFYGPGGSSDNFISLMVHKMLNNEPTIELTKGEQKRDFVYYTDMVAAFTLVINSLEKLNKPYSNFVVAYGKAVPIRSMIETIKKVTKSSSKLNFGSIHYRENELMESKNDNSAIVELGWKPVVDIEQGIIETVEFIKNSIG